MKKILVKSLLGAALSSSVAMADGHLQYPPGEDSRFSWKYYEKLKQVDLSGKTVSVFGPWMGQDGSEFGTVIKYFESATGAKVDYAGSNSFEQQIIIDVEAGSPPNIAIFPQPGLAADMAARGLLVQLDKQQKDYVRKNYAAAQSWIDLGTYTNQKGKKQFFGVFYNVNLKSLVWYVPENFEDMGYEVPTTMEELKALTDQIVDDGETPWCIGLGSGGATGWPATDWVEDFMLRTQPPQVYDQWVTNQIPFNDKRVIAAIEEFGYFALNDKYVSGGAKSLAGIDFGDSAKGLFTSPPKCYLHRQASFISSFFPKEVEVGVDADFFYFPAYASKNLGKPVLGAGTLISITKDSRATRAFIDFLLTPLAHEIWMAQGGFLTPHKGVNLQAYQTETDRKMGKIMLNADTFRFDGSDLMPGAVGAGTFWTGMVDYSGGKSAKSVANEVQKSWDTLK